MTTPEKPSRIASVDIVRGVVMIIMALDHVRDLLHVASLGPQPTDLATTTPILFFTRWITHLCAPTFVFLAGVSAYLGRERAGGPGFLIKRGLWLVLLEFTVVNFGLWFDPGFHVMLFEVIAAIGVGFVALGLMRPLPPAWVGLAGVAIIALHGLAPIPYLTAPAPIPLDATHVLFIGYPPLAWLGVMMAGYGAGLFFERDAASRRALFAKLGAGLVGLFVVLRLLNFYGDPAKWMIERDAVYTFLSFMNVTKYPPTLLFCLVTIGVMFIMLAAATNPRGDGTDRPDSVLARIAEVYGRVPMFYFVVHFYVIHVSLLVLLLIQGVGFAQWEFASASLGRPRGIPTGIPLWGVYVFWISLVAALYFPCRWFGRYKAANKDKGWLRYI